MVRVESLSDDQLTAKMSVLHCMVMSHGGELLARYRGLNQSHHEYVLLADSMLKGYKEKVATLTGLELQVSTLRSSLDNLHDEVARLSADLNSATVLEAEKDEEILRLKATPLEVHGKLLYLAASAGFERGLTRSANVPTSRDACVSPPIAKELTVIPSSGPLKLSANIVPAPFVVALEQHKEWVSVMVDGLDAEMTDGAAPAKSGSVFVQGISHALDDVDKVTTVGSERVFSGPTDVVVALSIGEKGDGSFPFSTANGEATANPSRV
ncbi:hypothetical protein Tco_0133260 [Tanacetum coccineum]